MVTLLIVEQVTDAEPEVRHPTMGEVTVIDDVADTAETQEAQEGEVPKTDVPLDAVALAEEVREDKVSETDVPPPEDPPLDAVALEHQRREDAAFQEALKTDLDARAGPSGGSAAAATATGAALGTAQEADVDAEGQEAEEEGEVADVDPDQTPEGSETPQAGQEETDQVGSEEVFEYEEESSGPSDEVVALAAASDGDEQGDVASSAAQVDMSSTNFKPASVSDELETSGVVADAVAGEAVVNAADVSDDDETVQGDEREEQEDGDGEFEYEESEAGDGIDAYVDRIEREGLSSVHVEAGNSAVTTDPVDASEAEANFGAGLVSASASASHPVSGDEEEEESEVVGATTDLEDTTAGSSSYHDTSAVDTVDLSSFGETDTTLSTLAKRPLDDDEDVESVNKRSRGW